MLRMKYRTEVRFMARRHCPHVQPVFCGVLPDLGFVASVAGAQVATALLLC
jgi:hypothetical protein